MTKFCRIFSKVWRIILNAHKYLYWVKCGFNNEQGNIYAKFEFRIYNVFREIYCTALAITVNIFY